MPRNHDPKTRESLTHWLSQFAPSAGTLGDVEKYWKSRWHELTRVQTDYDIHYIINNDTNGLVDDWTAVFVVDHDGERLAVYGYEGSYPYTMNEDDWVERIDGNRLPERKQHFVACVKEQNGTVYEYESDTLVDAVYDMADMHLRDIYELPDMEIEQSVLLLCTTAIGSRHRTTLDTSMWVETCNCAGHTYTAHYE